MESALAVVSFRSSQINSSPLRPKPTIVPVNPLCPANQVIDLTMKNILF